MTYNIIILRDTRRCPAAECRRIVFFSDARDSCCTNIRNDHRTVSRVNAFSV